MIGRHGFGVVGIVVTLFIIGAVGLTGWYVWQINATETDENTTAANTTAEEWISVKDDDTAIRYEILKQWQDRKAEFLGSRIFDVGSKIFVYENNSHSYILYDKDIGEWSSWYWLPETGQQPGPHPGITIKQAPEMVAVDGSISTVLYDTTWDGDHKRSGSIRILFTDNTVVREISIPSIMGSRQTTDEDIVRVIRSVKY